MRIDEGIREGNVRQDADDFLNFIDVSIAIEEEAAADIFKASIIPDGHDINACSAEDFSRASGLLQEDGVIPCSGDNAEINFLTF